MGARLMFFGTTKVAVHRATTETLLGDDDDDDTTPVLGLESVTVAITERSRTVYDQATSELRTIRVGTGRAVPGTDIRKNDRLHDLRANRWWLVTELFQDRRDAIGGRTLSFDLKAS